MKVILLGPPGSGKGTQGELLERKFGLPRLSVGALIRRLVSERSPLGLQAETHMLLGEAIPASIYMQIVGEWILDHPKGFVIDNLVRSYDQLEELKRFQQKHKLSFNKVFLLGISEQEARKRLLVRQTHKQRPDETPQVIHKRFVTYYAHLGAITEHFRSQGILEEINAEMSPNDVHKQILNRLKRGKLYDAIQQ